MYYSRTNNFISKVKKPHFEKKIKTVTQLDSVRLTKYFWMEKQFAFLFM